MVKIDKKIKSPATIDYANKCNNEWQLQCRYRNINDNWLHLDATVCGSQWKIFHLLIYKI